MLNQSPPPEKPLALVVDDDPDLGEIFAEALQSVGFETTVLQDSRLALETMAQRPPSLVSLDMQMPHLSGVDILRLIRADERFEKVKIIMVTANGRVSEETDVALLADVVLIKPVTFRQIKDFAERLTK